MGKYGVYIALLLLFVIMSVASSSFLTVTNLFNILKQNAVYGVLAVGMTFVIVTGGIDLSVGAIVAMSACFATKLTQDGSSLPFIIAILVGLLRALPAEPLAGFSLHMRVFRHLLQRLQAAPWFVVLCLCLQTDVPSQVFQMNTNISAAAPGA